jgi:hypothetical protein
VSPDPTHLFEALEHLLATAALQKIPGILGELERSA